MYHYETYLKHYIKHPISQKYYNRLIKDGVTMEQILNREITDTYFYSDFYIPWCDYNAYVPYDIKILRKLGDTIYDVEHYTYNDSDLNTSDELYIKSIERTDIRRKSCINQNMILFYKNYFKRKNEKNG